jgi:type II secretion system protein G
MRDGGAGFLEALPKTEAPPRATQEGKERPRNQGKRNQARLNIWNMRRHAIRRHERSLDSYLREAQSGTLGKAGFTLVEILVVITIIGLIMGLVGPRVITYLSESKVKAAVIQIHSFESALDLYYLDLGRYPTTAEGLAALVQRPRNRADLKIFGPTRNLLMLNADIGTSTLRSSRKIRIGPFTPYSLNRAVQSIGQRSRFMSELTGRADVLRPLLLAPVAPTPDIRNAVLRGRPRSICNGPKLGAPARSR